MTATLPRPARVCPIWRILAGVLGYAAIGLYVPSQALAHWVPPERIVAGLHNDTGLRERAGVRGVEHRERLLIIRVDPQVWGMLPVSDRKILAEQWYELWRHNVPQGIVAVVAAPTDQPLVNYDAVGRAHLLEAR